MATLTQLKTRHYPTVFFGADSSGALMSAIPRMHFMYYVSFNPSSYAMSLFKSDLSKISNPTNGMNFKVQSIDRPKVELKVSELNQYNRRRYAYTGIGYHPISVSIFDTVDDVPLKIWIDYFIYYFGDSRNKTNYAYDQSVVTGNFFDDSGWGFDPVAAGLNFFDSIDVYSIFGQTYSLVRYVNPKINNIDFGNFDSTDNGALHLNLTFSYESLNYISSIAQITPEIASKFGFDVGPAPLPSHGLNFGNNSDHATGKIPGLSDAFADISGVTIYSYEAQLGAATGLLGGGVDSIGSAIGDSLTSAESTINNALSGGLNSMQNVLTKGVSAASKTAGSLFSSAGSSLSSTIKGFTGGF